MSTNQKKNEKSDSNGRVSNWCKHKMFNTDSSKCIDNDDKTKLLQAHSIKETVN